MDTMYCEKLKCTLSKLICVKRQDNARQYSFGRTDTGRFDECIDCQQGQKVKLKLSGGKEMERKCSREGCDKPVKARWMCSTHYDQWYVAGCKEEELPEQARKGHMKPINTAKSEVSAVSTTKSGDILKQLKDEMRREILMELKSELDRCFERVGAA